MTARLPSKEEIALPSPDGLYAIEHFHGKTLEQAEAMFEHGCAITYTEDLMWMEPAGFRYYVQAFINYCLSERATGDSDSINGLEGVLRVWIEQRPDDLVPWVGVLAEFCRAIAAQFERFDAEPYIYGNLREKYEKLANAFMDLK